MLRIDHLTKTYGDKKAVDDLTLHIAPGEICGFIGHNGAGKTTTIKACCGILGFDSGDIAVDGISVRSDPLEVKRRIAYIPDNPDLYEYLIGIRYDICYAKHPTLVIFLGKLHIFTAGAVIHVDKLNTFLIEF